VKRFGFVVVLLLVLLAGGALTALLVSNEDATILPVLQTTQSADASPTVVLPWKADQLFLLIGFLLFNLIGMAVTIAVVIWLLDRGVRRSRAAGGTTTPARSSAPATTPE
jgi:hypothetical protein